MTNKDIVAALTLGFLAFALLPITTAEAACVDRKFVEPPVTCFPGEDQTAVGTRLNDPNDVTSGIKYYFVTCCCLPPKKADAKGRCMEASEAKADCKGRGPNYRYDPGSAACIKIISKKPEQTDQSEHSSDSGDEDHHKGKKKKRHHDADTQANESLQRCTKLCENQCLGTPDVPWDKCVKQCLIGTRC